MDDLRASLARAVFLAGHLHAMIPRQVWRDSGGDDGQGHWEGDYRAEQTAAEIAELAALAGQRPSPQARPPEEVIREAPVPGEGQPPEPQALTEIVARGLRSARDRRVAEERDFDFRRGLAIAGLVALDALVALLAERTRERDEAREPMHAQPPTLRAPLTDRTYFTDIVTGEEMVTMKAARYDELRDSLAVAGGMVERRDERVTQLTAERDAAVRDADQLRAALALAYPYVKDALGEAMNQPLREIVLADLRAISNARKGAALAVSVDEPATRRVHQALGVCWCGLQHSISDAFARNSAVTEEETP